MSFRITRDTLTPNLKKFDARVQAGIAVAMRAAKPMAESQMRRGAKWTDRTGNARGGLRAYYQGSPITREHSLILYHTMHYGIFLEVRWSGKFAIIGPTVRKMTPQVRKMVVASVRRAVST